MASPPPPYANVTGISRAVMKDSPQETFSNYDGNARAGELVVNLDVDPPTLYIGNSLGNLNQVTGNGGGNASLPLANGSSNFDIATANGNVTVTTNGTNTWTFDDNGNLTIPNGGNINFVNTGGITQAVNEDLRFTVSDDEEDGWAIQSIVNDGAGNDLTRMQVMYDGVAINVDIPNNNYRWDFRDSGEFDVPKSIRGPVGGNLVISIGDQLGSNTFIDLQTRSYVGDALISNIQIANPNVTVSTASGAYNWAFGGDGLLTLPDGAIIDTTGNNFEVRAVENTNFEANAVVNIYTDTSNNGWQWQFDDSGKLNLAGGGSIIESIANSSLDPTLPNVSTMVLTPDSNYTSQILVLDPTAPGHLHLRTFASSNIDQPNANLFLGGEDTAFEVTSGSGNEARIHSGGNTWIFENSGNLTLPGNIVGASANVEIAADGYSWTFTNIGVVSNPTVTYSALPSANTAGYRAFISDANLVASGNFGNAVSGGGSNTVPVYSDGTNWRIG